MNVPFLRLIASLFFLFPFFSVAQLTEDFSDGDFTSNPIWTGDLPLFEVNANAELQSQGNAATESIFLSTPQTLLGNTEWRIDVQYDFAPSSSNLIRIYLVSDQSDLRGPLNGYFVQVGETGTLDSYDLYRQDGNTLVKLIDGIDGRAGSEIQGRIRVLRTETGTWELYTDPAKTDTYSLEGSVLDNTYTSTAFFGLYLKHTSTRANSFLFDNVYVGPPIQDLEAPELLAVNPLSFTRLEVVFSEALDPGSAEMLSNYRLLPSNIGATAANVDAGNPAQVILDFADPLVNGNDYELEVTGLADLNGNVMMAEERLNFTFLITETAQVYDVIINEIFADPTPSQGLPEAEFLELFNRSNKVLNLEGWTISNGSTRGSLPNFVFRPGELLILAKDSDAGKYAPLGTTISPSPWTTLVNSGDNLGLRSVEGLLIDSVDYVPAWFRDEFKAAGGFSLERINPDNLSCPAKANWSASQNASGATPGAFNSVFTAVPEQDPPSVLSAQVLDARRVRLCFDEPMDATLLLDLSAYALSNVGMPIAANPEAPDVECVVLEFATDLVEGQVYELSIADRVGDCSGNLLPSNETVLVVLARAPAPFEIVFTELFPDFNPQQGLPEAEFVEVYNRSTEALNLGGVVLSDGGAFANLPDFQLFPDEYAILCRQEEVAEFQGFAHVLGLENFPSLGNATDSLTLYALSGEVLDYVYYSNDWYQSTDKSSGGFSLEKIDPDYVDCNQGDNWRASVDIRGGTPGEKNSIRGNYTDLEFPRITSFRMIGTNGLELNFSEQMDPASLESTDLYTLDQGFGEPVLAMAVSPHYRSVRLSFDQDFQDEVLYRLNIQGLEDCASNALQTEWVFGIPQPLAAGDVLINEILFNPISGGSDFVEIYNASSKVIELSELSIGEIFPETDSIFNADRITEQSYLFLPGDFLCLTTDPGAQIQQYQPVASANFLDMERFPSYDDASGEVVIFTTSGLISDRFYYEDDFHYPTLIDDEGVSLERISVKRPTQDARNWHSAASTVRYATPGYANSQVVDQVDTDAEVSLDREVFSPDLDGVADVVAINYDFNTSGVNARVSILDSQGRLIKILQQNVLLGAEAGTFFWDGSDAKGKKSAIGIYVVLFEAVEDASGSRRVYKLPVVLAAKF